ncbi:MAG: helix-turn-helix domain-containing protein [Barnesiella sp.]
MAKIIFMDNFKKEIKLEDVAARVNMSYSRFRYLFKEYTGFTPAQYIQELRVMHSKELLTNTVMNIKEIAFDCGFETCQYFCTVFKKKVGSTPIEYREFTQGRNI